MPATAEGTQQNGLLNNHRTKAAQGSKWHPTADEKADLGAINAAIDRMHTLTAPDPYVLTIPQDVEPRYHHIYPSRREQWLYNAPFSSDEHESLQYQTFLYHEHGKQMFVLHNSRLPELKPSANEQRSHAPGTGANTPNAGPKKKITLDAYKKKQNAGPTTPEPVSIKKQTDAKQAALKGPIERVKAETEEMLAAVAELGNADHAPSKNEARSEKKELKRKREEKESLIKDETPSKLSKTSDSRVKVEEPASKKHRRSPSPAGAIAKSVNKVPPPTKKESKIPAKSEYDETKLPPRLSPGMPPKLSPLRNLDSPKLRDDDSTPPLPSKLSPTIPENISNTLKARDLYLSITKGDETPRKADDVTKRRSPVPRNGFRANSSSPAIRSDVEEKLRSAATSVQRKPQVSASAHDEDIDANAKSKAKTAPSLVVKLKYKKVHKERIIRLLKTRPMPWKRTSSPSPTPKTPLDRRERGLAGKAPSRQDGNTDKAPRDIKIEKEPISQDRKTGGKRPLAEESRTAPPSKRVDSRKEPNTPPRPSMPSPSAATQKTHLTVTPTSRKDVLPHSMKREISQDSFTAFHTPPAMANTPVSNQQLARPPSSQPSIKNLSQQAWDTEQKRLQDLGKSLKRDAGVPGLDPKVAAAKSIESLICYILAFTCADHCSISADTPQNPKTRPWRTLVGFQRWVTRMCEADPTLQLISASLAVAWISHILDLAVRQVNTSDALEEKDFIYYLTTLRQNVVTAEPMDADYLREKFPLTWESRSRSRLYGTPESSNPSQLLKAGRDDYSLPFVTMRTPPFRAARAAYKMLKEWTEASQGQLSYTFTLAPSQNINGT